MSDPRMSVITAFLGQQRDRFNYYHEDRTFEEKLLIAKGIPGMVGVEIVFPYEVHDSTLVNELLRKHSLVPAAVNVNIKAEPEFTAGSLSHSDPETRRKAVRFIREAKDFAEKVGADKVTCCPLADGYEYAFQYDYGAAWRNIADTISMGADYKRNIPLFIEYKPSETRGKCFIDSAAKALLLLKDIGIKETGVTLDFGHSIYGNENPAEALCLLQDSPFSYYIHINDNDQRWDWDYFAGSKHYIEFVEFLYYLKKFGYSGFITSDSNPTRYGIKDTFEANNRITTAIWKALDAFSDSEFENLLRGGDFFRTWHMVETEFLHPAGGSSS